MFHVEHHAPQNQKGISHGVFLFIMVRNSQRSNNFHTKSAGHICLDKVNRRRKEGAKGDEEEEGIG